MPSMIRCLHCLPCGEVRDDSLRAGFCTAAAANGVPEGDIMRHSRHKSVVIMRGYVRPATLFDGAPLLRIISIRAHAIRSDDPF